MAGMFDDLMNYLMGGTPLGNMLGVGSPTASTQTPTIVPSGTAPTGVAGPVLGGAPASAPAGGGGGLLGGQAPVNPMSWFQPQQGLLGNSPLANMVGGALGGLASVQPGQRGLAAFGAGAMGGEQAVQDRRKQQMTTALAGQQYQKGQQSLISDALANQSALLHINNIREFNGLPPVTMADITANPDLVSNPTAGQPPAPGSPAATGQSAPATQTMAPIAPTMTQTDPHLTQAQAPSGTLAGPSPQTVVATQYGNQHGIIVPQPAPPTAAIPSTTNVQPQSAAAAQQPAIPMTNGTTSAPPVTTAAPPTQQSAGELPWTRAEINASNLPGWAKDELIAAGNTGDWGEIMKARADVGKYMSAPQQAGLTKTAEAQAQWGTPEEIQKQVDAQTQLYEGSQEHKNYQTVKPAYDAGMKAYKTLGHGGSAYDLINAAIQAAGGTGVVKPGVALSASEIGTFPAEIQALMQQFSTSGNKLDKGVADQLAGILQNHMDVAQQAQDNLVGNLRVRAQQFLPPGANERLWHHDMPAPPPPTKQFADKSTGKPETFVLVGGTYDPSAPQGPPDYGWSGGDWKPQ